MVRLPIMDCGGGVMMGGTVWIGCPLAAKPRGTPSDGRDGGATGGCILGTEVIRRRSRLWSFFRLLSRLDEDELEEERCLFRSSFFDLLFPRLSRDLRLDFERRLEGDRLAFLERERLDLDLRRDFERPPRPLDLDLDLLLDFDFRLLDELRGRRSRDRRLEPDLRRPDLDRLRRLSGDERRGILVMAGT